MIKEDDDRDQPDDDEIFAEISDMSLGALLETIREIGSNRRVRYRKLTFLFNDL
jgi:predicted HAD superfamily phosphohydrolase